MTATQVAAAEPTLTRGNFGTGCTQFYDKAPAHVNGPMFNVLLTPPTNQVIGVSAPAGYQTDTGVGIGASRAQVKAAYPGRHTEETSSQGGQVLLVQGPSSWIGFTFGSGTTVLHMSIGSRDFAANGELCVGPMPS